MPILAILWYPVGDTILKTTQNFWVQSTEITCYGGTVHQLQIAHL